MERTLHELNMRLVCSSRASRGGGEPRTGEHATANKRCDCLARRAGLKLVLTAKSISSFKM
jgi:hypothetical protein